MARLLNVLTAVGMTWTVATVLSVAVTGQAGPEPDRVPPLRVYPDGSVSLVAPGPAGSSAEPGDARPRRYGFGLPDTPPTVRRLEGDGLPVTTAQWGTNGIRYTQVILVTRLRRGELPAGGGLPEDAVLMVQVTGENLASEYTTAAAAFSVRVGGQAQELELRDEGIWEVGRRGARPLALVDIPATGIVVTRGAELRFRGSMPPGTSGAMTLKIPLRALAGEDDLTRLRELDFDEELRRLKRHWADCLKAGVTSGFLLEFAPGDPARFSRVP